MPLIFSSSNSNKTSTGKGSRRPSRAKDEAAIKLWKRTYQRNF